MKSEIILSQKLPKTYPCLMTYKKNGQIAIADWAESGTIIFPAQGPFKIGSKISCDFNDPEWEETPEGTVIKITA